MQGFNGSEPEVSRKRGVSGGANDHKRYPKVDFRKKIVEIYTMDILSILVIVSVSIIGGFLLAIHVLIPSYNDTIDGELGSIIMLSIVFGFSLILLIRTALKEFSRFMKSGSQKILIEFLLSLGFIGFLSILILFLILPRDISDTYIYPALSTICMIPFMDILILGGISYSLWAFSRGNFLGLYPQIIASAERETDEYLDGYSDRPFESEMDDIDMRSFAQFSRLLMKNMVIYDYHVLDKTVELEFPRSGSIWRGRKRDPSWMKVRDDGTVSVYITPEDYNYLNVPISYHLLCEKTIERISIAYAIFLQGRLKESIDVFSVDKKKNIRNKSQESFQQDRELVQ